MTKLAAKTGEEGAGITTVLAPYLLMISLSILGIFEGTAVGTQKSTKQALNITIAILLHAWTESLALGISFAKNDVPKKHAYMLMLIFCTAGPLGVVIGWILAGMNDLMAGIFEAIAAGTFIFIASVEIIVEEFSVSEHKKTKLFYYFVGVGVIIGIWFSEN